MMLYSIGLNDLSFVGRLFLISPLPPRPLRIRHSRGGMVGCTFCPQRDVISHGPHLLPLLSAPACVNNTRFLREVGRWDDRINVTAPRVVPAVTSFHPSPLLWDYSMTLLTFRLHKHSRERRAVQAPVAHHVPQPETTARPQNTSKNRATPLPSRPVQTTQERSRSVPANDSWGHSHLGIRLLGCSGHRVPSRWNFLQREEKTCQMPLTKLVNGEWTVLMPSVVPDVGYLAPL